MDALPLTRLASLFRYPSQQMSDDVQAARIAVEAAGFQIATRHLETFAADIAFHTLHELQERYAHTFDFNGDTTLETGWHLFGEQYARGIYLAKVRRLLAQYEIAEEELLPDNLLLALILAERLPEDEAGDFIRTCVIPACAILRANLEKIQSSYAILLSAVEAVLSEHSQEATIP